MRSWVFRALAGLLAIGFAGVLLFTEEGQLPMRQAFWVGAIAAAFGLFALFGRAPADQLLGLLFGVRPPANPNKAGGADGRDRAERTGEGPVPVGALEEAVGIETRGGVFTPLIERGTPLPAAFVDDFSTAEDNQPGVTLNILAGNGALAKDARELGCFHIENLPAAARGIPRIRVTLSVDVRGIVRVVARHQETGNLTSKVMGEVAVS